LFYPKSEPDTDYPILLVESKPQIYAMAMDDKADFLPLLHQFERDFRELERATTKDYPQALANMKGASKRWCVERLDKSLVDTITYKSRYQRTEIMTDKLLLSELMLKIETLVRKLRETIPILIVGGFDERDFVSNLGPTNSAQLFSKQKVFDQYGPNANTPDPYVGYQDILKEIRNHIDLYDLVQVIHSYIPEDLSVNLFELTKGIPQKELPSDPSIPNWCGIENCLRTALAFRSKYASFSSSQLPSPLVLLLVPMLTNCLFRLEKERKGGKSPFDSREFDYLLAKMDLIRLMIFNSTENRKSKKPKVVRNLDLDLAPYITPPEKIMTEFFSPTEYVMKCFRNVLKLMGYDILHIEGDGNCFFRATIKSIFPNVPRDWEDSLSVMVRKSLNKGQMQRAMEAGIEYPYQGFVINNVNDSVTMAKVGQYSSQVERLHVILSSLCLTYIVFALFLSRSTRCLGGSCSSTKVSPPTATTSLVGNLRRYATSNGLGW
jgi:hypothetical protein